MRHQVDGRKFGRNTSHRRSMFRNMANSVILQEQIVTTVEKAKEARRVVDRLITLGKQGTPQGRRLAFDRTRDNTVVAKLFKDLAERYKSRAGGYTRILKISDLRRGDSARMAIIELVDHPLIDRKRKVKTPVEGEAAEGGQKTDQQVTDPLSGFRKLFTGKKKGGKGDAGGAGTKAAKRAPAAKKSTSRKIGES